MLEFPRESLDFRLKHGQPPFQFDGSSAAVLQLNDPPLQLVVLLCCCYEFLLDRGNFDIDFVVEP